jgi:TonB-dependent starch-binding outer membrane protein SusC
MARLVRNLHVSEKLRHHFYLSLKVGFSFILTLFICSTAFAQDIDISGTVTSTEGEPLPGVTIMIQGTDRGTTTDIDGNYSLSAPSNATLVFSYIGFITLEENVQGRSTINVVLAESVAELDELIVTGYTAQRRADITGSISTANLESVNRRTSSSVLQRLDGAVAGVTVQTSGSPGARSTVRIRGISSFQNNDPLYIIDGTPVQDDFANWLNPNDIESIQVLKDASAASIYGSRANNGVIIIETNKGQRGTAQVSVDLRTGVASPVGGYNDFLILDALEYHEVVMRSHRNAGVGTPTNIYGNPDNPSVPNYIWPNDGNNQTMDLAQFGFTEGDYLYGDPNNINQQFMPASTGTDWWDAVFGTGIVSDMNVAVSGGGDNHRYNVSFNYFDQEGTAAYNRFQRGTIRVNTEFDIGLFTIGENITIARDQNFGGLDLGGGAENTIVGKNILSQPVVPVYDVGGNFASGKAVGLGNNTNPLKYAWANKDDISANNRIMGNAFARANLLDNQLLVTSRFGFNLGNNTWTGFSFPTPENSEPNFISGFSEGRSEFREWTWSNTANYIETFAGNHNVNILAGQEVTIANNRWISASMSNYITSVLNARYIQDALGDPETKNVNTGGGESTLLSFFGKVDYHFDDRYHLSLTIRRDGSSRLGPDHRWGTFPAASVGWRVSEEAFMDGAGFISNLMIRAGWGITGNQAIPTGRLFDQFGGATGQTFYDITGSGSNIRAGYRATSLGNPNLRWEENESYNLGFDLELYEGRFNVVFDVFQREVDNLLFDPPLPATAGVAAPPIQNVGMMRNRGFDFSIGYRGIISDELSWSVNFNGTHYKNEILRIDGEQDFFTGPISGRGATIARNYVGQPIGAFFGMVADGIFMNWDEVDAHAQQDGARPGRMRFVDVNGDGQITAADRTMIGNPHPDFVGGLDFGVRWRNWDFNTSLFGSFGNDIFDVQKEFYIFRLFNTNVRRDRLTDSAVLNIDGPAIVEGQRVAGAEVINPDAKYPRLDEDDVFSDEFSSFYVEDGSYVRMRALQIGYNVPPNVIPGVRNLRVYVQGENLFTITGYSSVDPSLPTSNVGGPAGNVRDQTLGVDRGTYPSNRTISIGISASF